MELNMAKKKRGRPPGSKNKKSIGKSVATMDVSQLRAHIDSLQSVLAKKIHEQRAYFEDQLSQLGGYVAKRASAVVEAATPRKRAMGTSRPVPSLASLASSATTSATLPRRLV